MCEQKGKHKAASDKCWVISYREVQMQEGSTWAAVTEVASSLREYKSLLITCGNLAFIYADWQGSRIKQEAEVCTSHWLGWDMKQRK